MTGVNILGTDSSTYQYITLSQLGLPGYSADTSSFQLEVFDPTGLMIEYFRVGAPFKAQYGTFTDVQLSASNNIINSDGVTFTFKFKITDPLTKSALFKVVFPPEF